MLGSRERERPKGDGFFGGRNCSDSGHYPSGRFPSFKHLLALFLEEGETEAEDEDSGKALGKRARWVIRKGKCLPSGRPRSLK